MKKVLKAVIAIVIAGAVYWVATEGWRMPPVPHVSVEMPTTEVTE